MRELIFTVQASERMEEIADWTFETFGPHQALKYQDELIDRCAKVAAGLLPTQNCSVLLGSGRATSLRFGRAGRHLIIFILADDHCIIVDLLHSASDLAGHLEELANLFPD